MAKKSMAEKITKHHKNTMQEEHLNWKVGEEKKKRRENIRDPCSSRPRYRCVPSPLLMIYLGAGNRVGELVVVDVDVLDGRSSKSSSKDGG